MPIEAGRTTIESMGTAVVARRRPLVSALATAAAIGLLAAACAGSPDDDGAAVPDETATSDVTAGQDETPGPAAAPSVELIALPNGFQPEGVAAGSDGRVFVGSLRDGDIWQGDLDGAGAVLVDAPAGRISVGLAVDEEHGRVFAAGGPTGQAFVYDSGTGEDLEALALTPTEDGTFVNDVVVTPDGAWFTDSRQPVLYLVPFEDDGALGPVEPLDLTGPAADLSGQFNLNGITASADGSTLIVVHSGRGEIITVDAATGDSAVVDLGEVSPVPNGDGILLDGTTLWVVQNFLNQVARVDLADDLATGVVADVLTSEEFRIPTTLAVVDGRLVVVNARFDIAEPSETDEYELVVLTP